MDPIFVVAVGYLLGSLPAAWVAGKVHQVDLTKAGSGNLGATNTLRVLGAGAGAAVLAFDAAKGAVAVLVLPGLAGIPAWEGLPVLSGLACVLGHVFPPWFGFRGGKGVATGAAVATALAPWSAPVCLAVFALVVVATRIVALGSVTAALVLPLAYVLIYREGASSPWVLGFFLGASVLVLVTHRSNLRRWFRGEEPQWGSPKPAGDPEDWLDRKAYPFRSRHFPVGAGNLHYIDEGTGDPIVFVHGNPSWSFEFRHLITALSPTHRCIAVDHLGFGLSDKPQDWTYLPADHARNLESLLDTLDLRNLTLVVGDWGGPIGLSYALNHPDRIKALVVTNSWLWSVADDWYFRAFSGFVGGPLGTFLIRQRNFFVRDLLPRLFGVRSRLTPELWPQYLGPLSRPEDRTGNAVFPREIVASSDWLASLWARRPLLNGKSLVLVWGMKDIAFRQKELDRWTEAFPDARVLRLEDTGHLPAEEHPEALVEAIRSVLATDCLAPAPEDGL